MPEPEPRPTEAELAAALAHEGLVLRPEEKDHVLATARFLRRAADRVDAYLAAGAGASGAEG